MSPRSSNLPILAGHRWLARRRLTERLYYTDPALLDFDAVVTRIDSVDGRPYVFLDRSAFYPTSGGQLHDVGTLNDVPVLDVVEVDEGLVAHVTARVPAVVGERVAGKIDSARRWRNRQQHTAQHVLSAVMARKLSAETVSVHLGEDYGAIELDIGATTEEQIAAIESEANTIIHANVPVTILTVSHEEAVRLPLRKPPTREGQIRVIRIGDVDWSACGGTHCAATIEVGVIKVIAVERIRGHVVVRFLAGQQAFEDYRVRFEVTDRMTRSLTCHVHDLIMKVDKIVAESKSLRKELAAAQKELLPIRARSLTEKAGAGSHGRVVTESVDGLDSSLAGTLASLVAEQISGIALLLVDDRLAIGTAESTGLKAGQVARQLSEKLGVRGGGGDRSAQIGGVNSAMLAEIHSFVAALIENA